MPSLLSGHGTSVEKGSESENKFKPSEVEKHGEARFTGRAGGVCGRSMGLEAVSSRMGDGEWRIEYIEGDEDDMYSMLPTGDDEVRKSLELESSVTVGDDKVW